MVINNLNRREKYLAAVTVSVISIAALYTLVIAPLHAKWKDLNSQIRSKVNMLETAFKILANQKAIGEEYVKLSKYARAAASEEEAAADMMTYIENISKDDSCLILNVKPAGITKEGSCKEILVDVSAEAGINQFSKFLYDIENQKDTLMNVKRFTISSKSGQSDILKGTFLISKTLLD